LYSIGLKRNFEAYHYLIGNDWGEENKPHIHKYRLEVTFEGEDLDKNGFLIDIIKIEKMLDVTIIKYENNILNELSQFKNLNPSIENFSRIICEDFYRLIKKDNLISITVKVWEDENAYASYRKVL
jgi:6-pyruvoyltetrahydropterin/6-carboxytetrahydropterin synthase